MFLVFLKENYQKVDIQLIFDRVLKILSYRIVKESVEITNALNKSIPKIETKVTNLQQVILNIVGNALDAVKKTSKKKIHIHAHQQGIFLHVTITDTGSGISPEHLKRIFDPFFTTKPVGKGTGLGLSVSRGIIERLRGKITCESQENAGTCFRILLPINALEH